ncbi:MAG: heme exporter protein CcmB [Gemmatimonadota bacterium]|nr:heme exporter protein CcmB [Gemmatimonadota bacterium]
MQPDVFTTLRTPGFVRSTLAIASKDMLIELRSRSVILSALAFALLSITIFFFAWDPTAVASIDLAPGVLWVIFTFSGLLGLHRSFGVEQPTRAMDALLAAPVDREAIYLGKLIANLAFVLLVQAISLPAVALLYNVPMTGFVAPLIGVILLASVGLVAVGTLFSSMAVSTRLAELLLPLLALPFFVPVILPAAQATARLMGGRALSEVAGYIQILAAFDVIFLVVCTLLYPYTLEQ